MRSSLSSSRRAGLFNKTTPLLEGGVFEFLGIPARTHAYAHASPLGSECQWPAPLRDSADGDLDFIVSVAEEKYINNQSGSALVICSKV